MPSSTTLETMVLEINSSAVKESAGQSVPFVLWRKRLARFCRICVK